MAEKTPWIIPVSGELGEILYHLVGFRHTLKRSQKKLEKLQNQVNRIEGLIESATDTPHGHRLDLLR